MCTMPLKISTAKVRAMLRTGPKTTKTTYVTIRDLRPAHQQPQQGLAEIAFEFDEGLTHWSPEKPPKPVLTASPTRKINEQRSDARNAAINAIAQARHNVTIPQPTGTIKPRAVEVGFVVAETAQPPKAVRRLFK